MKNACYTTVALILLLVPSMPSLAFAGTLSVTTQVNAVREDCRFFSPVVKKVNYGDRLERLEAVGDWFKVEFDDARGCIHKSAVTTKKIKQKKYAAGKNQSASADEVALAGKGFNADVEDSYRQSNPELDFEAVDTIEGYGYSESDLRRFIEQGRLNLP